MLLLALGTAGLACAGPVRTSFGVRASYVDDDYGPRVYYVDDYPGYLWVDGQYRWVGGRQIWRDGYWVRDRPNYVYRPGYYHPQTRVWVSGRWEAGHHRRDHAYQRIRHGDRDHRVPPPTRRRHY
jgi:hypothetical protein